MKVNTVVAAQDLHVSDFVHDEMAYVVAVNYNPLTGMVAVRFDNGMRWNIDEDFQLDIRAKV